MTAAADAAAARTLPRYGLFGAALAFAGPPIYIHAPQLYAVDYGLGLAAIGAVLLLLRALDFAQDPILGWWIGRTAVARSRIAAGFAVLLGVGALLLFWPDGPLPPALRLGLSLAIVFTGFSALQILFYSGGVALAKTGGLDHARVAGWRETGVLAGVCLACVAPELLKPAFGAKAAYGVFAALFCALLAMAVLGMRRRWPASLPRTPSTGGAFRTCWRDRELRRLLTIGLFNALPSGLTATLFLFFVEDRLQTPGHAGPALLAFFLAAALAAPFWARAARRFGQKRTLLAGMTGAIAIFLCTLSLGPGDWFGFYLVAIGSGAAMGADMTLLPAMLSRRLAALNQGGEAAFGVWGFVNKAALALAAGLALPALDAFGFQPGAANSAAALTALSIAYAGAPCILKALALVGLALTPIEEGDVRP